MKDIYLIVADFLSMIICAMLANSFYSIFGKEKRWQKFRNISYNLAFVACGLAINVFLFRHVLFVPSIITLFFLHSFLFEMKLSKRIYSSLLIYILLVIGELLTSLLLGTLANISMDQITQNVIIYMISAVLSKLIIFSAIKPISHKINLKNTTLPKYTTIAFIVLPVTTFAVLIFISNSLFFSDTTASKLFGFVIAIFLVLSNLIVFYIFDYIQKSYENEKSATERSYILEQEKMYYASLFEKQCAVDKAMHDLKHKFFAIEHLITEDSERAKQEIGIISKTLDEINSLKIMNMVSVDALINSKVQESRSKGIKINVESFVGKDVAIDEMDLCVLIGNLLDNAIEACEKIEEESLCKINLRIKSDMNFLLISVRNSSLEPSSRYAMKTTKKDWRHHGLGLASIKEIVEKYNGQFHLKYSDGEYIANALLQD